MLVMRVAEQRDELDAIAEPRVRRTQLALDLVERELGNLEQHQAARRQLDDLAAQLRTDGSAGTGDQDRLAANAGAQQRRIRRHRIAAQKIVYVDVADLFQARFARDDLGDIRHGLHLESLRGQRIDHLTASAARGARHGEQHERGVVTPAQLEELLGSVHPDTGHSRTAQRNVVIDEGDRAITSARAQRRAQLGTGAAGTVDEHALGVGIGEPHQFACTEPRGADVQHREREIHHEHRVWNGAGVDARVHRGERDRRDRDSRTNHQRRVSAHVAHHRPVQADAYEHGNRGGDGHAVQQLQIFELRRIGQAAQLKRGPQRQRERDGIRCHHDELLRLASEVANTADYTRRPAAHGTRGLIARNALSTSYWLFPHL